MNTIFLAFILLLVPGLVRAEVQTGAPAPNFTLKDTQGVEHSLSGYKGKFVVLEWLNPDCPFVKKHYNSQNMPNLQKTYTGKGVIWMAIDSSANGKEGYYAPAELNMIMQKKGTHATAVLVDSDGTIGKAYGAQTTPHMFVVDPAGNVIYQGAIDSIASADPADISKSQNYVQAALDEAMAGKPVTTPATKSYGCSVKY